MGKQNSKTSGRSVIFVNVTVYPVSFAVFHSDPMEKVHSPFFRSHLFIINNILCGSISKVHKYLSEICGFY